MRGFALGAVLATIAMAGPAAAAEGKYQAMLQKALDEMLSGRCSTSVLSASASYACENAPAQFKDRLKQLGAAAEITYRGVEATPMGQQEVYVIKYSGGARLLWMIGVASDGKVYSLYTPG